MKAEQVITELFDLGGVIAGGFAVSHLYGIEEVNDFDFFFKDLDNFKKAKKHLSYRFDVVHYKTEEPYDLFDLSISRCYLDRNGKISMSKECLDSYRDGIIKVDRSCLINPYGTLRRLAKYKNRFGLSVDQDDLDYVKEMVHGQVC